MRRAGGKGRHAALVRELDIPAPFDLGEFVAGLERQRHRPIRLSPFSSGPGVPCGLWIGTAEADYIYHEQGTTPYHQTHIALHELAVIARGGGRDPIRAAALWTKAYRVDPSYPPVWMPLADALVGELHQAHFAISQSDSQRISRAELGAIAVRGVGVGGDHQHARARGEVAELRRGGDRAGAVLVLGEDREQAVTRAEAAAQRIRFVTADAGALLQAN